MNILIVKLSAIGDVIHTLPSLAALRKLYPEAHITWVIEEAASDLIQDHPALDCVLILRRKSWVRSLSAGKDFGRVFREARDFRKALRSRSYDLVIDFHGLLKSAVIVWLSGGKRKIGYDSMQELSGLFLNEKIPEDMEKHAVDRYLDFVRYLGAPEPTHEFFIAIQPENVKKVSSLLQENGIRDPEKFIAVSPTALWKTKLWDDQKFALLCDQVISELKIKIVLTGARNDSVIRRIKSLMKLEAVDLSGKTSLRDLAWLYKKAALLITTDSGPMHLAAAVGTPVIALFGPTSPARTGPYNQIDQVIRAGVQCSPCFRKECESMICMKEITVESVWERIREEIEPTENKKGSELK